MPVSVPALPVYRALSLGWVEHSSQGFTLPPPHFPLLFFSLSFEVILITEPPCQLGSQAPNYALGVRW